MSIKVPRVFISYSHDSPAHGDRVLALSRNLRQSGIETILDRYENPPEEGWPRWMTRSIRDADFVLMVCTETYYRRVMGDEQEGKGFGVAWEGHLIFQHIYDRKTLNRKFIPVGLSSADRAFVPDPLRAWDFYNLDDDEGYNALYRLVTGQKDVDIPAVGALRELPVPERRWKDRPPPPLIRVPRLPTHYLERTPELTALKQKLFAQGSSRLAVTGSGPQLAVQGMAGIGKTILAASLCRDQEVGERFPDGIIWLTLGQTPNIERRQIDLYECFSSSPPSFQDVESGRIALARLLADKRCLVVVDDVWNQTDARAFDVIGTNSALLVTTRDASIVRVLGLAAVSVGVLDEEQAMVLLASSSGRIVGDLTPEAREVVRECGHLPLAIAMVGAMVHGLENPWPAALSRLNQYQIDRIRQEFPDYPYPDLLRAVQASTDYISPHHRRVYSELAIFPEDIHIPEETLKMLWSSDEMDELEMSLIIRDLAEKSLLFRDEYDRCFLHDVQRAFLIRRSEDLPGIHAKLLARYAALCPAGWASGPDDGYFFEHLIYHLGVLGRFDEALSILTDFKWLTKQLHRDGLLAVLNDCNSLAAAPGVDEVTSSTALAIRDALKLSGHLLEKTPDALAEQMHGRLQNSTNPAIQRLLEQTKASKPSMWLRPTFASLDQPGGRLQRTIPQPSRPAVALSLRDGRILSAVDKTLLLYDQASGVLLGELGNHNAEITHAAVTADGLLLVSASEDGILKFFRVEDGSCVATKAMPQDNQHRDSSWTTMPEKKHLPPTYIKRLANVPGTSLVVGTVAAHYHYITQGYGPAFGPFGLWLIDATDFSFVHLSVGHTKDVTAIAVTPSGDQIISGSEDGTIRVWDREKNSPAHVMTMPDAWAYAAKIGSLVVTPDGKTVISASSWSGPLKFWDLASGQEIKSIGGSDDYSIAMALSVDGATLYVGGYWSYTEPLGSGIHVYKHPYIRIWDVKNGIMKEELRGHHGHLTSVALSEDGLSLLSASSDETIRVWRLSGEDKSQPHAGNTFDEAIDYVRVDLSAKRLLAANKYLVASFDLWSGQRLAIYEPVSTEEFEIEGACFSPDGKSVLVAVGQGDPDHRTTKLDVYDTESGQLSRSMQQTIEVDKEVGYFQGLHVTPDGHYAIAVGMSYAEMADGGFANQAIALWEVETGRIARIIHVPTPHHGKPFAEEWPTAVSTDSRYFCFGTVEDEFRLCDLKNDFKIVTFGEHKGWIGGVTLLAQSGLAVTAGGNDEYIRAWSLVDGAMKWQRKRQGRNTCIGASPSERYLVLGNDSNELRVLAVKNAKVAASFRLDAPVKAIDVCNERPIVAVGDDTGRVHAFVVENCPDW